MSKLAKLEAKIGTNVAQSIGATDRPRLAASPAEAGPPRERVRADSDTFRVPLDAIDPDPDQPRKTFDPVKLAELAASLKESGQLQACVVRPAKEKGRYVLVCGERRLRAAAVAGLASLLCRVQLGRGLAEILADQLAENLQRDDFNPVDLSDALVKLRDEHGWTTRQIADRVGINQSTVSRSMGLAGLDELLRERVRDGRLAASTAIAIARLPESADQIELAVSVTLEKLSREAVEERVRAKLEPPVLMHGASEKDLVPARRNGSLEPADFDPISEVLMHGASKTDPSTYDDPPSTASVPSSLVGPAAPDPGAVGVARTKSITWVTDTPDGMVLVELSPGRSRGFVAGALRQALAAFEAEESCADRFPAGQAVKISDVNHPLHGREGTVERVGFGGLLDCVFPDPFDRKKKPMLWSCSPRELVKIHRSVPEKKGGRP